MTLHKESEHQVCLPGLGMLLGNEEIVPLHPPFEMTQR